jgi:dihydrofolate synthase / folylpolyglutamate synthase
VTPRTYLASLEFHGIKLGLDNITHLLTCAENPHNDYPSVHVAGTNGKGSVVAVLDAIVGAAGYRTGRFTSPHLITLNERFLCDRVPIGDEALDEQLAFFQSIAETMDPPPTYFELVTAVAFRWFAQQRVECALVEVGMGGRFDSTNVLAPVACAITNIDLEHTQYLGDTREAIAFEKAGILKSGTPAIVAERQAGPLGVIEARAREVGAPLRVVDRDYRYEVEGPTFEQRLSYESEGLRIDSAPLGLPGRFQGENAATAVSVAEVLRARFPRVDEAAIRAGLSEARWPCRMERVLEDPPVIIDVAHNAAGAARLAEELGSSVIVLAVASDKAAREMVHALAPRAETLILTRFTNRRGLEVAALSEAAGDVPHVTAPDLRAAIAQGMAAATTETPLVIAGSLFAAGEARAILAEEYGAKGITF